MTIDETIIHCLEVAEKHERHAKILKKRLLGSGLDTVDYCLQCAAEHRQLAEWLTELKELRNSVGAVKLAQMKDALNLISDLRQHLFNSEKDLIEAKRLLRLAVEDITFILSYACSDEEMCCEECPTVNHACNKWRYADEALKLLGGSGNG